MYNGIPLAASAVAAVGGGYSFFKTQRNESLRIVGFSLLASAVGSLALAFITRKETVETEGRYYKAWRLTIPTNMFIGLVCGGILGASSRLGPATKKFRAEVLAAPILLWVALSLIQALSEYRNMVQNWPKISMSSSAIRLSSCNGKVAYPLFRTLQTAFNVQVATTCLIAGLILDARFSLSERIARSIWRVQMNRPFLLNAV